MHEVSLVAELISECERQSDGQPVTLVRVRHASSITEPALRQAFRMLSSRMADAILAGEMFEVALSCGCRFAGALGHDDQIGGSVAVCPVCGAVSTLRRTAELELLELPTVLEARRPPTMHGGLSRVRSSWIRSHALDGHRDRAAAHADQMTVLGNCIGGVLATVSRHSDPRLHADSSCDGEVM